MEKTKPKTEEREKGGKLSQRERSKRITEEARGSFLEFKRRKKERKEEADWDQKGKSCRASK